MSSAPIAATSSLRPAAQSTARAILLVDAGGSIAAASEDAGELFGCRPADLVGRRFDELVRSDVAPLTAPDLPPDGAYEEPETVTPPEIPVGPVVRRADGSEVRVRVRLTPLMGAGLVVATIEDADAPTLDELAEDLRVREERLRLVLDETHTGFWDWNAATGSQYLSDAWTRMLGYEPGQFDGDTGAWERLLHPEDRPRALAALEAHLAGRTPIYEAEYRLRTRSGDWKWILARGRVVERDVAGRPLRMIGIHTDVSARREAEERLGLNEERLSLTLESTGTGLWDWNARTGTTYFSDTWSAMLGYEPGELGNEPEVWERLIHPDDLPAVTRALADHFAGRTTLYETEHRLRAKDGTWRWVHDRGKVVERDAEGRPLRMIGIQTDIGARKAAEEALFREQERALVTLESIADAVIVSDAQGRIEYMNPVAALLTGWTEAEAKGRPLGEILGLVHETTREPLESPAERCLRDGAPVGLTSFLTLVRRDGDEVAIDGSAAPLRNRAGELDGVVMVFRDVTRQRQAARRLSYEATHDALTGLVNRAEFERRLARVVDSARTDGTRHALCFLDLDRFKYVNDTCGHRAGDELLRQLGAVLRGKLRLRDTLARLGGDEFGVLLEHCDIEQARRIAEELRVTVQEFRFSWDGRVFAVGASIGLVALGPDVVSETAAMAAADAACYRAKHAGRNRVHVWQPDDAEPTGRGPANWAARLTRALESSRFRLYAQPIVALDPKRAGVSCWEVFLRLEDESGELLPAAAFLPAAERYSLSAVIDQWVIRHTIERLAGWRPPREADDPPLCCINLASSSLRDDALPALIRDRLRAHRLAPESVCFEIAESAVAANPLQGIAFIHQLRAAGCRVALDDFGASMSSLAQLRSVPVDLVKISPSIIARIDTDPLQRVMLRAVQEAARVVGIPTIAKGADTSAVLAALRDAGVAYAQGFALARPRPIEELMADAAAACDLVP